MESTPLLKLYKETVEKQQGTYHSNIHNMIIINPGGLTKSVNKVSTWSLLSHIYPYYFYAWQFGLSLSLSLNEQAPPRLHLALLTILHITAGTSSHFFVLQSDPNSLEECDLLVTYNKWTMLGQGFQWSFSKTFRRTHELEFLHHSSMLKITKRSFDSVWGTTVCVMNHN